MKLEYSLQRRLQLYVVIVITLVALISGTISSYIYINKSVSSFYEQADKTLTYFENAIIRQKLIDSSNTAKNLASLPETSAYIKNYEGKSLPPLLKTIMTGNQSVVMLTDSAFKPVFSSSEEAIANMEHFSAYLKQFRIRQRELHRHEQMENKLEETYDNMPLGNVGIPEDAFYYGDLQGSFLAMAATPVYSDKLLVGYVIAGYDLTTPEYTDYIGKYFGMSATIFYHDIRVNTNLENSGYKYLGTTMDDRTSYQLFSENKSYYGTVSLGGIKYLAAYRALRDNQCVSGAIFIGQPESIFYSDIHLTIILIASIVVLIAVIAIILTGFILSRHINVPIEQTAALLRKMAQDPTSLAAEEIPETREKTLNQLLQNLKKTAQAIAEDRQHLSYLAFHDRLTGCYNSKRLYDTYASANEIESELEKTTQINNKLPALVLNINIDFFKRHKKYLGQQRSEKLLLEVAVRLRQAARYYNCDLYRITADEFIACSETVFSNGTLEQLLEDILQQMRIPFEIEERFLQVSVSIGAARKDDEDKTLQQVLQKAAIALDAAKYAGRNRYEFFDPETAKLRQRYISIEEKLRSMRDYTDFELYYQPQVDSSSGSLYGLEALIRWHDPDLGNVSPAEFIPMAEAIGLISPISSWVIRTALQFLRKLNKAGIHNVHMSINISAVQLTEPDFYALLNELVSTYNIAPKNVVLEITETQLVESFDRASSNLTALRDRGFTIAIDDFGTGYSSLSYLSNLPVGIIKIDQSFIQSMNTEKDLELVREMIRIGHNLKISVISKGVETKSQLEQLQKLHCEYIQGYLISRPMPADQTFTWIRNHNTVRTLQ